MEVKKVWKRISSWEQWPFSVIYAPLGFVWVYYAIRARSFWFFSNVNPTLEFSGFEGETKREMYQQLPAHLYPQTIFVKPKTDFKKVLEAVQINRIKYPFIVKPDVGMQGILFRKIEDEKELAAYHYRIPADYIIQDYVDLPLEFSVFYIRYPGESRGKITGFILKEYMSVQGDGKSTVKELIIKHPKAQFYRLEMERKHAQNLQRVLPKGEKYTLSIAGNHNRGAKFINLHNQIDDQLCDVFDKISQQASSFYFGRYDLKCASIEDLKAGRNFYILEYNGTGAEPNHIYDCGMTYFDALKEVVRHWKDWFEIGKINRKQGVPYWGFMEGYRYLKNSGRFFKELKKYDHEN